MLYVRRVQVEPMLIFLNFRSLMLTMIFVFSSLMVRAQVQQNFCRWSSCFCRASFDGVSSIRSSANSKHFTSIVERVRPGILDSFRDLANSLMQILNRVGLTQIIFHSVKDDLSDSNSSLKQHQYTNTCFIVSTNTLLLLHVKYKALWTIIITKL